jgi:acyl transferase domain-containing protein/acyl carrier protein/phospholipid N-methyltransferase
MFMSPLEPIAMIGIGCRLPGGVRSADDLWELLVNGVDAITETPESRWRQQAKFHSDPARPGRITSRFGGFIDGVDRFDAQFFGISPREAAAADPQQRVLLEVAYAAAEDAGLTMPALSGRRAAVYVGISGFDYGSIQLHSNEPETIDSYTNLGASLCVAANRISYFFNLVGPSIAVDTACSSALVATHLACRSLWSDETELAFVGGVNLILQPTVSIGFSKAAMLSPDGRCKSFDARANGYVRGEGAGMVVLKPLARALADGDNVYAVIRATAVNQDGRTAGISVPNGASQRANILDALAAGDIDPATVQYVEAHGTGTPVGDPIEARAIGDVYGQAQPDAARCTIGSLKSNIGHLESASGIAGLIKTALCLKHRAIPGNLHFETPNPDIAFDDLRLTVARNLRPWPETATPPRAGINSFGFGGTNAHAILEAPPAPAKATPARKANGEGRALLLPLSARSEATIVDIARGYRASLDDPRGLANAALSDLCFSAATRRSHHDFRLALVAHNETELAERLDAFLAGEARPGTSTGRKLDAPGRPVFVCSGMGQQWWAMGHELLAQEPVFRRAVEAVSDLHRSFGGPSLIDKLMADEAHAEVQNTDIGQPAIFALQVGLAALWQSWGIEPAAVVGHSAGEMAAAYIAGALTLEDAACVTYHRSRLQYRAAGQGGMLAAGISREEAERLAAYHRTISLAAVNSARSVTLSGDADTLAGISDMLERADVACRTLQVDVPFHSAKMDPLEAELLESLRGIRPRAASVPLFSTVTGRAVVGPELDARYWYRNVRQPVLFADAVGEQIRAGHKLFLEIGAHPILRNDLAECLKENGASGTVLSSLRRHAPERATLLGTAGRLYVLGSDLDWTRLLPAGAAVKLPSYPFQPEVHWRETERSRQQRVGTSIHPLLGNRVDAPAPSWQADLDIGATPYLADHRIGSAVIFPAAGYIEMALAAARETFGAGPCALEDWEFQKFLPLDGRSATPARIAFDSEAGELSVHARTDAAEHAWVLHARGNMRGAPHAEAVTFEIAKVRARCGEEFSGDKCRQRFAALGLHYGPAFHGLHQLWRGEGEALADIRLPSSLQPELADYRLHPAVLDACLQASLAVLPDDALSGKGRGRPFVPVRIDRVRFYATPAAEFFAAVRVREFSEHGLTVDIDLVDTDGRVCVAVNGLVCRPPDQRAAALQGLLYEYQWQLKHSARPTAERRSDHLPGPADLSPVLAAEAAALHRRFDRARFENEFQAMARAAATAYIARALRELGFEPQMAGLPPPALADRLGLAPQYRRWLALMLHELTPTELASRADPQPLWKAVWHRFPECQVELTMARLCGENLVSVLRGETDPLQLVFPEGTLTAAEHLYQDSPALRPSNLLAQKAVTEIVRRLPPGRALRVLEIGGGTGGLAGFLLPVLPAHATQYVFTDVSARFLGHAQQRFTRFPFVECRTFDIERNAAEQGIEPHAFDLVVASDVLHATRDLGSTLDRVRGLLGTGGLLLMLEVTRPWLHTTLVFGLLPGWWLFEDSDVRPLEPVVPMPQWQALLERAGFDSTQGFADAPDAAAAQHSLILARAADVPAARGRTLAPRPDADPKVWLVLSDRGGPTRSSAGAQLAVDLEARGDRVIQVTAGADFARGGASVFTIRPDKPNDMRRLLAAVSRETKHLAGVVHFGSLDLATDAAIADESIVDGARAGCVGALHLVQALATADELAVGGLWLVTRAAQGLDGANMDGVIQSPLWGLGRVAGSEYQNLRCVRIDLATASAAEIAMLAAELTDGEAEEDELALHGELRYVRRLTAVSTASLHATGQPAASLADPFRLELAQPGLPDSLTARPLVRRAPGPIEIEIEIAAAGLNFKDLMTAMGMVPKEALADPSASTLLGLECAGRVIAVGSNVTEFVVGDEVVAAAPRSLASHITIDHRFAARKPATASLEQAATLPIAFVTAYYSLHTLADMKRGERVLIHAAAGGVGLAAVQLALAAGAIVFATAGSREKRDLLKTLGAAHVFDSRSLAFADEILDLTGGEGVDIVLNSLAGEAIDKNLSILRPFGRFVEIGLVDIYKNRRLGMRPLRKNVSLFAVDLSRVFDKPGDLPCTLLREAIGRFDGRTLTPLPYRVFPADRVPDAFRAMAQAQHIGKLVVSMQDRAGLRVQRRPRPVPIDTEASYLITGGLGGFGLALASHLADRGARYIVLTGRSGPSPEAQSALDALAARGVEAVAIRADVTDRDAVARAIAAARAVAPLRGVIHAAMVLDDAPIERLNEDRMWKAMAPKMLGAWHLHALTEGVPLDFLLLCSSITSTIGNPGQANYVAGNAFLDALAYYRRGRGLPALTVNLGNIGEVGYVARNKDASERLDRYKAMAMPIADVLDGIDDLLASNAVQVTLAKVDWSELRQLAGSQLPARIAGLVSELDAETAGGTGDVRLRHILDADAEARPALLEGYIRDHLARAIGASPSRIDPHQSLLSLGLDSLIAVEVRNRINSDFGLNVPLAKIIQSASVRTLAGYLAERLTEQDGDAAAGADGRLAPSSPAAVYEARTATAHRLDSPPPGQGAAEYQRGRR